MNDASPAGVPTCYRHPGRETWIRCQRCEQPICPDCMRDAAVGFQCPDCVRQGARETRQITALYGGKRSGDPRLTSYVLIAINAIIWLVISATGGARSRLVELLALVPAGQCGSVAQPDAYYPAITSEALCRALQGGDGLWRPGVADGAWWQVITSAFTHVEIWHIALNMMALYVLGPTLEQIMGRARFLAVYLLGAVGGSLVVLWLSDATGSTLGASGALFGVLGGLLVTFTKARLNTQWIMQNLVLAAVITIVGWRFISWQGHLGGFLGGAAAAVVIAFAPKARRSLVQWAGIGVLLVVLLGLALLRAAALA
ncbi:MAG: rhomboid family intramembrane serine protease [Nocardioides sp.]|nr:rhomboid family intramembrane serine protease [Nocardioides sp.]